MGNVFETTLTEVTTNKLKPSNEKSIKPIKSPSPSRKPLNNRNSNQIVAKKMEKCRFVRIPPVKLQ